jgi:DNA (cytosine-5)-methyltransferase 1
LAATTRTYGVKLVRGPFVRLPPHGESCSDEAQLRAYVEKLRAAGDRTPLAADLFSGAGGLSLGLRNAGIRTVLSVDHDVEAVETHAHHFPGLSVDWDLAEATNVERVAALMTELGISVLAGGPPCQPFSKAGRSGIRDRVRRGLRDPHDQRRDLWRSFLEVAQLVRPAAVLMENVPDMALDREMFILRSIVEELEQLGYAVEERVADSWRYGVPQFRQRLILVALKDGIRFDWPDEVPDKVTVWNAIGDLPEVEGGWRPDGGAHGWAEYTRPQSTYQRRMRATVPPSEQHKVFDHITRPVREDDWLAFEHMDSKTRYSELPKVAKRYREDIFDDKYKRLDENDLSRTITAHIAKDGYWYIHPRQGRTITVREAARLQSFPDSFRFAGPPSAAFRQIGNAVPPLLAEHLGRGIVSALEASRPAQPSSRDTADMLAGWLEVAGPSTVPWLRADTRWLVISAEMLFDRLPVAEMRLLWPVVSRWRSPSATLKARDDLLEAMSWVGRRPRAERLLELAEAVSGDASVLDAPELKGGHVPLLPESAADIAVLVVETNGDEGAEEPVLVTKGVVRVAARYLGEAVDRRNKLTDGRLAVARLIGGGVRARDAHRALIELAASVCTPETPACHKCPLSATCATATAASPVR